MDARIGDDPPYLADARAKPRANPVLRAIRIFFLVILPLALLGGAVVGFGYLRATRPVVPVERQSERPRMVQAVTVQPQAVQPMLLLYGQIVAGRSVDLRALVAGEIISASPNLVEGGRVAEGEELLRIDPFAYEGALIRARADLTETRARIAELEARVRQEENAIERAREQFEIGEREVERLSQLSQTGASTLRAVDEARLRFSQTQASLESRENQLAVFEAQRQQFAAALERQEFALRQAERTLSDTTLRAPFAAFVSNPAAEPGKLVSANDRIATLAASDRLEARFALSDAQYGQLAERGDLIDRPVTVTWRAGRTTVEREAQLTRIAPQVSDASFAAFALLEDGEIGLDVLRPGAFVEVRMLDRVYENAVTLPPAALYENAVFAIEDARLVRVPIEILTHSEDGVVVQGDIPAGAQILSSRLTAASTGQLVEIRP
jgi:membrane fusion protein, multidrug efflux system